MLGTNRVLLCMAVFLLAASVLWANGFKEEPLLLTEDAAPFFGPVNQEPVTDVQWDILLDLAAETVCADNQLLGCEFAQNKWFITGGHNNTSINQLYILDAGGALLDSVDQPTTSSWGWRDMAYDGTYLYAGDESTVINAISPVDGSLVPAMNIPRPAGATCTRALTYDPATDHFWTGNFSSNNYIEFGRDGTVFWSGAYPAGTTGTYGFAWDAADPAGGPWLWIFDQSGTPQTTIKQYNPVTHTTTGVQHVLPLLTGSTAQIAGGLGMTSEWNSEFWTIFGITQGTPIDRLFALEMYLAASGLAPAAPSAFDVENNGPDLVASLSWVNPTTTINGSPLVSIDEIIVERDGAQVASLTGTPGEAMAYDDNVPAAGMYGYTVYAVNDEGNGSPANDGNWIGLDVPGGVTNLVGSGVGTELIAELTWENPLAGFHGGYWPVGSIDSYIINRYGPSVATFNLAGMATSYIDNTIPMQGWYHYGVIAQDASGNGPEVASDNFYVGPPEFEEIPYAWVEINPAYPGALPGINTLLNGDDQNLGPFPLGFTFYHYDNPFSSIRMCSNGFASFTSTATVYTNVAIPTAAEPNNLLAPYWDDLNMNPAASGFGQAFYYYDAANERFIAEWDSIAHYSSVWVDEYFTFEIILYPDGNMDFMYKAVVPGTVVPFPSATVGKENAGGTVGVQCTFDGLGPLEPVSGMGIRIYGAGPPPPPELEVTLVPFTYPIQIPASGGSFQFYAFVNNLGTSPQPVTLWSEEILPDGSTMSPLLGPANVTLAPGTTGWHRNQNVPGSALPGIYTYIGNAGIYPNIIYATDSFIFEKLTTGNGPWVGDWNNWGDPIGDEMVASLPELPTEFALNPARPNPFNAATTISFALPEAARINLCIYDVSGRAVVTLVDGWRDAGTHQVTFDGFNLASGVYALHLNAGIHSATGKLVLMK